MIKINGTEITDREILWGVEFEPVDEVPEALIVICADEPEARQTSAMAGGSVKCRTIFSSDWADAPEL